MNRVEVTCSPERPSMLTYGIVDTSAPLTNACPERCMRAHSLVLQATPGGSSCCYLHFADEDTEAQRTEVFRVS